MTMEGTVKWFDDRKGYGFINEVDTGEEYFVHYTGIVSDHRFKKLHEGDQVTFEVSTNEKGQIAVNVKMKGGE